MSFTDITITNYTDLSVVVYGETRKYKEDLKKLGGKYNSNLKNGAGWVFPKTSEKNLKEFILKGKRLVSREEIDAGELKTMERSKKDTGIVYVNKKEDDMIIKLTERIDMMDKILMLMSRDCSEKTQKDIKCILNNKIVNKISYEEDEEDEEDENIPIKRLMK